MSKTHKTIYRSKSAMRFLIAPLTAMLGMLLLLSSASAQGGPALDIENQVAASPNSQVTVPINFVANGSSINAMAFSVDFDESLLTFDPTDNNGDGIPDAISFNLPAGFSPSVSFDASDTDGEIDIAIFSLNPTPLTDGTIASITFTTGNVGNAAVNFSLDPPVSFGGTDGSDVPGTTDNGSVLVDGPVTPTPSPSGTYQLVINSSTEIGIYPGDTFPIELTAEGANLYGVEANCQVNPNTLQPVNASFGQFFTSNPILIGQNQKDPVTGDWSGGLTLRKPATPLSGPGLFATVIYQAINPGMTDITCNPLFSDENGFEQGSTSQPINITVLPFGRIASNVTYQGRLDHTNINITGVGSVMPISATVNSTGDFTLSSLRQDTYNIEADAPLYLPSCIVQEVTDSTPIILPQATPLSGGDTNDNDMINIGDATLLAAHMGSNPPSDTRADINADNQVNIQDLSILGSNYGLVGCQPWS